MRENAYNDVTDRIKTIIKCIKCISFHKTLQQTERRNNLGTICYGEDSSSLETINSYKRINFNLFNNAFFEKLIVVRKYYQF